MSSDRVGDEWRRGGRSRVLLGVLCVLGTERMHLLGEHGHAGGDEAERERERQHRQQQHGAARAHHGGGQRGVVLESIIISISALPLTCPSPK
eukprot:scaffold115103_cov69-Phaeocystis_antarctica.AAC.4